MPPDDKEGTQPWNEYRYSVLTQLEDMNGSIKELTSSIALMNEKARDREVVLTALVTNQVSEIKVEIAMLKVRAKIWAGIFGGVGALFSAVIVVFIEKVIK